MRHVASVGSALCQYLPGHGNPEKWPTSRCDCKYGMSGRGEETGCPEMRTLYRRLHMDEGFGTFVLGLRPSSGEAADAR